MDPATPTAPQRPGSTPPPSAAPLLLIVVQDAADSAAAAAIGDRYYGPATVRPLDGAGELPSTWHPGTPLVVLVLAAATPPEPAALEALAALVGPWSARLWVAATDALDERAWREFDAALDEQADEAAVEQVLVALGEDPALTLATWVRFKGSLPATGLAALPDAEGRTCRYALINGRELDDLRAETIDRDDAGGAPLPAVWTDALAVTRTTVRTAASANVVDALAAPAAAVTAAHGAPDRQAAIDALAGGAVDVHAVAAQAAEDAEVDPALTSGLDLPQQEAARILLAQLAAQPPTTAVEESAALERLNMAGNRADEEEHQGFWARLGGGRERQRAAMVALGDAVTRYVQAEGDVAAEVADTALMRRLESSVAEATTDLRDHPTGSNRNRSRVAEELWSQVEALRGQLRLPAGAAGPGGFGETAGEAVSADRVRCHVLLDPSRPGAAELIDEQAGAVPGPDDPQILAGPASGGSVVLVSRQGWPLEAVLGGGKR